MDTPPDAIEAHVFAALNEDCAFSDATSAAVVPAESMAAGAIIAREKGILSGCTYVESAFRQCDPSIEIEWFAQDGDSLSVDQKVFVCKGSARGLLAAERTALNFLQQLSGVATAASMAAQALADVVVLDTRKTIPGMRDAQKAAVVHGGGTNHRRDLEDQLLLKENHFSLSGLDYRSTVAKAVREADGKPVGIEAETIEQAEWALSEGATYVMLDNFHGEVLHQAVARIREQWPDAVLEASGGYNISNLPTLLGSGVNRVSIGAFTHSAPALDLSFYLEPLTPGGASPLHA